uniref:RH2 domain-containing protein n=1 Tax=Plectus sambesii TaxID=2011161 RepID=A0A914WZY1_9BILA
MDYMERTKYLMGSEKFDMMQSMPLPSSEMRTKIGLSTSVEGQMVGKEMSDVNNPQMTQSLPMSAEQNLASQMNEDWQDEFGQSADMVQSPRSSEDRPPKKSPRSPQMSESESNRKDDGDDTLGADLTDSEADEEAFLASLDTVARQDSAGMGREVENLIKENTELLETKNALNIVKNDLIARVDELSSEQEILREEIRSLEMVRAKMGEKIKELETELKATKEKLEDAKRAGEEGEDDVPLAQKKRFTRVEMARVLMERNQYKEKLMELQEAIKWTEMVRAKRHAAEGKPPTKKKGGIWDFFSGLFTGADSPPGSARHARYRNSLPDEAGTDPSARRRTDKKKAIDFLDPEYSSERRAVERREQYKLVKAHVKKDEGGRLQAYGWSIPAQDTKQPGVVPVPIFCRPLMDQEPNLKIWCGAGVTLSGGRTKDGGFIVGESVFYSKPADDPERTPPAEKSVDRLDFELRAQQKEYQEFASNEWDASSLIWVCSSAHGKSQVTVLDANNPNLVLDAFHACTSHLLCVVNVPGVRETDYPSEGGAQSLLRDGGYFTPKSETEVSADLGKVEWVVMKQSDDDPLTYSGPEEKPSPKRSRDYSTSDAGHSEASLNAISQIEQQKQVGAKRDLPDHIKDGLSKYEGIGEVTTALPTMWMGSQNEYIFVHSAVSEWRKCLRRIKMPDSVLSIVHYKGRIFAALANGKLAAFSRDEDGQWSAKGYHAITVGKATSSVRTIAVVAGRIWAGYRNTLVVFNAKDFTIETVFSAHPRKDSQVRQLVWIGDGVWVSIRLDSTLRLYHAHTYQHLQDVDIEPYVSKLLGSSKLGFSFIRTTALLVSCRRLWIGTGTGVIISVPLSENNETKVQTNEQGGSADQVKGPGGLIRVYSDPVTDRVAPGTFIPYCNMTQAQLSFHGHKDAVKFFLAVPGEEDEGDPEVKAAAAAAIRPRDMSHLIVWEVEAKSNV